MYIDEANNGVNPLAWLASNSEAKMGKLGLDATRYQDHQSTTAIKRNPNFTSALAAMHNADEAMLAAAKLVTEDSGRLSVNDEQAFLQHLARVKVELSYALEEFSTVNSTSTETTRKLLDFTAADLDKLDKALTQMGVDTKVDELAASLTPKKRGMASNPKATDYTAAATILETHFPGHDKEHYLKIATTAVNAALGKAVSLAA